MIENSLKRILFLRHGIAEDRSAFIGPDAERSLTELGRLKTSKIVQFLTSKLEFHLKPAMICSSDFLRATQTAELLRSAVLPHDIPYRTTTVLRPEGTWEDWQSWLAALVTEQPHLHTLIVVGHEPHLSSMVGKILHTPAEYFRLKKAGVAILEQADAGRFQLTAFMPPKMMVS